MGKIPFLSIWDKELTPADIQDDLNNRLQRVFLETTETVPKHKRREISDLIKAGAKHPSIAKTQKDLNKRLLKICVNKEEISPEDVEDEVQFLIEAGADIAPSQVSRYYIAMGEGNYAAVRVIRQHLEGQPQKERSAAFSWPIATRN